MYVCGGGAFIIIFWCSPERNLQSDFKPSACLEQIMGYNGVFLYLATFP